MTLTEALGDKLAGHIERGAGSACYGVSCRDMTREELLAVIDICGGQIQFQRESHQSTIEVHRAFNEARSRKFG